MKEDETTSLAARLTISFETTGIRNVRAFAARLSTLWNALPETAALIGLWTAALGACVLLGWSIGNEFLTRIHPEFVAMAPKTALLFVAAGTTLFLQSRHELGSDLRTIANGIAALVTLLAGLKLLEYATGLPSGINDDLVFNRDTMSGQTRVASVTAFVFFLDGIALMLRDRPGQMSVVIRLTFALAGLIIGTIVMLGYGLGIESLYSVGKLNAMAVHTALGLTILSIGILHNSTEATWLSYRRIEPSMVRIALGLWAALILIKITALGLALNDYTGVAAAFIPLFKLTTVFEFMITGAAAWTCIVLIGEERRTRAQAEQALARSEDLFHSTFENAAVGMSILDLEGRRIDVNTWLCKLLGFSRAELLQTSLWDTTHPDDVDESRRVLQRLAAGEMQSYQRQKRLIGKNGKDHWVKTTVALRRDNAGNPVNFISVIEDIRAQKDIEHTRDLLIGEISHRVKNTLAIVQGMARELLRTSASTAQFAAAFETRLQSLSKSHDLLNKANWKHLSLGELVDDKLITTFAPYRDRITLALPVVQLRPQIAITLGLVLHELMTNAIKYGSLSAHKGRVELSATQIDMTQSTWLNVTWREVDGPEVVPASGKGFGSFMLERGVKHGLGGKTRISFKPSGLICELEFPLCDQLQSAA